MQLYSKLAQQRQARKLDPASEITLDKNVKIKWFCLDQALQIPKQVKLCLLASPLRTLYQNSLNALPPWTLLCVERCYVWWTSWNISSRGIGVSGPYSLQARRSNADTICLTTSSKNIVANCECNRERNSKEICRRKRRGK